MADDDDEFQRALAAENPDDSGSGDTESDSSSSDEENEPKQKKGGDVKPKAKPKKVAVKKTAKRTSPKAAESTSTEVAATEAATKGEENLGEAPAKKGKPEPKTPTEKKGRRSQKELEDGLIETLEPAVTDRFGDVVWAYQSGSPWWPAHIYDPRNLTGNVKKTAMKAPDKKFTVYFYNDNSL
jgi:hypothetical protein